MKIELLYPIWMLLMIPAVLFTLISYFRISKKYRRTRNRIISMILHTLVMLLCVSVLAGARVPYEVPYLRNEIILLVDGSYSTLSSDVEKDRIVEALLEDKKDEYRVGIVVFGYGDPVLAAEIDSDVSEHYIKYRRAMLMNDSGTDIAGALTFAKQQFENPKLGKIVIISDGLETDNNAENMILSLAAEGVKVDAIYVPHYNYGKEVQVTDVTFPDYTLTEGDTIDINVTIHSSYEGQCSVSLFEDDISIETKNISLSIGKQNVVFKHTLNSGYGFHKYKAVINSSTDELGQNNVFYHYLYLEKFDRVLILERTLEEARNLEQTLSEEYTITRKLIEDAPTTIEDLRTFDEIILANIANSDMPEGFVELLTEYVEVFGGGLLTTGGDKSSSDGVVQNAYLKDDMHEPFSNVETPYQKLLPVECIDFIPPIAVMVVLDRSGSMQPEGQADRLALAKDAVTEVIYALDERDFMGIIAFNDSVQTIIDLTPLTERSIIKESILGITAVGETVYSTALDAAYRQLQAIQNVEKKHVIFVTDGEPSQQDSGYAALAASAYTNNKITTTVFTILVDDPSAAQSISTAGGGNYYNIQDSNLSELPRYMRQEVQMDEIRSYNHIDFQPSISAYTPVVNGVFSAEGGTTVNNLPMLGGFYGARTRGKSTGAVEILSAMYTPVYSQWRFGKGTVGSFLSDLSGIDGTWGRRYFVNDNPVELYAATTLLNNIVKALLPRESLRYKDIRTNIIMDNYSTHVSVITGVEVGEKVHMIVNSLEGIEKMQIDFRELDMSVGFANETFYFMESGLYEIVIEKVGIDGYPITEQTTYVYRPFAYSKEYNMFIDAEVGINTLTNIANTSGGVFIENFNDVGNVFNELKFSETEYYDLRIIFIITALVLFLLDIAVRKFKFKWIHEIIRERRLKKEMQLKAG